PARVDRRQLHRGGVHGGDRARTAVAGEHCRAVRAKEAEAESDGHSEIDEALHLCGRIHRHAAAGDSGDHDADPRRMSDRALPPVTALGMASLALILAGGIYLAAHLPRQVALAPAVLLLVASALLLAVNLALLARVRTFPWWTF